MNEWRYQTHLAERRLVDLREKITALEAQAVPPPRKLAEARACWQQLLCDVISLQHSSTKHVAAIVSPKSPRSNLEIVDVPAKVAKESASPSDSKLATVVFDQRSDGWFALTIKCAAPADVAGSEIGRLIPSETPRDRARQSLSFSTPRSPGERSPADHLGDQWGSADKYASPGGGRRRVQTEHIAQQQEASDKELRQAALNGDLPKLRAQLKMGVDVDGRAGDGQTALCIAASEGYRTLTAALVEAGADLNLPNSQTSFTPLHSAVHAGHKEVVRVLVAAGADLSATNRRKKTALQLALSRKYTEIAQVIQGKDRPDEDDNDATDSDESI